MHEEDMSEKLMELKTLQFVSHFAWLHLTFTLYFLYLLPISCYSSFPAVLSNTSVCL